VQEYCIPTPSKTINYCPQGRTGNGASQVALGFDDIWQPTAVPPNFAIWRWPHATGVTSLLVSNGALANTGAVPPLLAAVPVSQTRGIRVHAFRITFRDTDAPGISEINEALANIISDNSVKTAENRIRIINLSLGTQPQVSTEDFRDSTNFSYAHCDHPQWRFAWGLSVQLQIMWAQIRDLRRQGVLVVAASGNNYGDSSPSGTYNGAPGMNFPACLAGVVSASATWDSSSAPSYNFMTGISDPARTCSPLLDRNACYAQRNWLTKVAAPGSYITTAWTQLQDQPASTPPFAFTNSNSYFPGSLSPTPEVAARASHGTSFSTPLVSACLAQILQAQPSVNTAHLISLIAGNFGPTILPRAAAADASSTSVAIPAHLAQRRDSVLAQAQDPYTTPLLRCQELLARVQSTAALVPWVSVPEGLKLEGRSGLSGSWFDPSYSNQGLVLEVNPQVGIVFGGWYTFTSSAQNSNAGLSWYTIQSGAPLASGIRSVPVTIYRTAAAALGFNANPGQQTNMVTVAGNGTIVFQNCAEAKFAGTITPDNGTLAVPFSMTLQRLTGVQRCANDDVAQAQINQLAWRGTNSISSYGEIGLRQYALSGNWTIQNTLLQGLFADIDVASSFPFIGWYTYSPLVNPNVVGLPSAPQHRWFSLIRANLLADPTPTVTIVQANPLSPSRMRYAIYRGRNGALFSAAAGVNVPVGYVEIRPISPGGGNTMNCNSMQMIYKFAVLQNGLPVLPPDPAGIGAATTPIALASNAPLLNSFTVDEEFAGLTGVYIINRLLTPGPSYCHASLVP
jgi:hypothetical protein